MKDVLSKRKIATYPPIDKEIKNHKIPSFDEVMEKLQPELVALDEFRKEILPEATKKIQRYNPWYFMPVVFILFLWWDFSLILVALFICFAIWTYSSYYPNKSYFPQFRKMYKTSIVRSFINILLPGAAYYPEKGIHKFDFLNCGLFYESNDYESEDLVQAKVNDIPIRFSEVFARHEWKNGDDYKHTETVFSGIICIMSLNRDFTGEIVLKRAGSTKTYHNQKKLFIKNPAFSKYFDIYTTNEETAEEMLTPSLMKRILELDKKVEGIMFSFYNSCMYITVPDSRNRFEGSLKNTVINRVRLEKEYELICFFVEAAQELNHHLSIPTDPSIL